MKTLRSKILLIACIAVPLAVTLSACGTDPNVKSESSAQASYKVAVSGEESSETELKGFHAYGKGKTEPVTVNGVQVNVLCVAAGAFTVRIAAAHLERRLQYAAPVFVLSAYYTLAALLAGLFLYARVRVLYCYTVVVPTVVVAGVLEYTYIAEHRFQRRNSRLREETSHYGDTVDNVSLFIKNMLRCTDGKDFYQTAADEIISLLGKINPGNTDVRCCAAVKTEDGFEEKVNRGVGACDYAVIEQNCLRNEKNCMFAETYFAFALRDGDSVKAVFHFENIQNGLDMFFVSVMEATYCGLETTYENIAATGGQRNINILPPEGLSAADWLTEQGREEWESAITSAVMALHGNASSESTMGGKATYFVDVSACVLGVTVDPGLDNKTFESIKGLNAYSFSGEYVQQCSGARGFLAFLYETVQKVSKEHYGYYTPTAISVPMNLLQGPSFVKDKNAFPTNGIVSSDCEPYYYSDILIDSETAEQIDGKTVYDRYASLFAELQEQADPVLASGVTFSDVNAVYGQEAVTEKEQGTSLTDALRAAKDTDLLGAVLFDLNDTWGEVAAEMKKFSASADSAYLWHNICDRAQRTGVLAMDSVPPENPGLVLSDADLVQAVSVSDDAGYVYLTIQLFEELDFKEQAMFVGLDTFQRNDGEYFYAKDFTATSLSGMEYSLRFDGKQKAALYVISSYDRVRGTAYTKESYTASYDKVADLTYGSFSAGDAQFYQTGSTVYVRLPWTWLNVADPSRMLVINDRDLKGDTAKTMTTNGMLVSVMVGERKTGDLFYGFPKEKHDPGYKTFVWKKWETAPFAVRQKDSFAALKKYWAAN